ncbi:hypothetical protein QT234_07010 [Geobacillus stearothermophilus]|nr:hypothetical protein QT234_07010 [Geobacillus stearothermophilus]WJQ04946.1 hypothetical protein QT236_06800 [Geobacillus stearothermophilus]
MTYTKIEWNHAIPEKLLTYHVPKGFQEVNQNSEQIVTNIDEAKEAVGFLPDTVSQIPSGYVQDRIAIIPDKKLVKLYYRALDKEIVIIQGKAIGEWKLAPTAMVGKIHHQTAEIQSPVVEESGVIGAGGPYAGLTDLHSIRWRQNGFEYAVIGHASLGDLIAFTKELTNGAFEMPTHKDPFPFKPKVEVPVDLEREKNDQKTSMLEVRLGNWILCLWLKYLSACKCPLEALLEITRFTMKTCALSKTTGRRPS